MLTKTLQNFFSLTSAFLLLVGLLGFNPNLNVSVEAAREPDCDTTTTQATFNPYPLTRTNPNPVITDFDCQDMPMLSFFPIDTANNNPRQISIVEDQNITFHAYYNNGANPANGAAVTNPNLAIAVNQVNNTKFCIAGTLSGGGAETLTSAAQGGDICINAPEGTELKIVANTVKHFPDAIERKEEADTTGRSPSDPVLDNSVGGTISNPIYTKFPGTNLPSRDGYTLRQTLEPGFLNYGYVLGQIAAFVPEPETNEPPALPGQEITIVRGEDGSFDPYAGTDPNGDLPITYINNDFPAFCNYSSTSNVTTCSTDEDTPVRTTYTVTPTDSKGLSGSPATFIVNVIEADKAILATSDKTCVRAGTQDECRTAKLQPGEQVIYTITVSNTGKGDATGVRVVDDYDEDLLEAITPNESESIDITDADGFLNFNIGTLAAGESVELIYQATIQAIIENGTIVVNTADITADDLPKQTVSTQFPVVLPDNPALEASKSCLERGTQISCANAKLTPGEKVTYEIVVTNVGESSAYNVQVRDDYDEDKLNSLASIEPDPSAVSDPADTLTWNLGTLEAGDSTTIRYTATIASDVKNGEEINNVAKITSDNLPDITVETSFVVTIVTIDTPRSGGQTIAALLLIAAIGGGGYYYYRKNGKLGKNFIPKRSEKK